MMEILALIGAVALYLGVVKGTEYLIEKIWRKRFGGNDGKAGMRGQGTVRKYNSRFSHFRVRRRM